MNELDTAAAGAFESSAIVRRAERGASALRSWAHESRALAAASSWRRTVRPYVGQLLVAAALTHLALAIAVTRPPTWHFAVLPSIFLAAGIVLSVASKRPQ